VLLLLLWSASCSGVVLLGGSPCLCVFDISFTCEETCVQAEALWVSSGTFGPASFVVDVIVEFCVSSEDFF